MFEIVSKASAERETRPSLAESQGMDPATLVLAKDLVWVPLGDLLEGDEVWAFDEMPKGQARRTCLTTIESKTWSRKAAFAITTAGGQITVASREQRFLSYSNGWTLAWRRLETVMRPYGEGKKAGLATWIPPWELSTTFDGGWLSGMFDGEGSLTKRTPRGKRNGNSLVLVISQNAGPVLEHVKDLLSADGFVHKSYPGNGKKSVYNLWLLGGTREFIRFLGTYQPRRLLNKLTETDCDLELWMSPDPIVDMTAIGMKDLVHIQTGEGTYFANGFGVSDSRGRVLLRRSPL